MSGIRKILAGLINPRFKIQNHNQNESVLNNFQNSSNQAEIGEKLGNANNFGMVNNGNISPNTQISSKSGLNNNTNLPNSINNSANLAENLINQADKFGIKQDIINAQVQINSQNKKLVNLENLKNNSTIAPNSNNAIDSNSSNNKLNQILFGDNEPINNNQPVKQENIATQDVTNTTSQNIINNEKASQAISYQVNNDVVKNTNKEINQGVNKRANDLVNNVENSALNVTDKQGEQKTVQQSVQNENNQNTVQNANQTPTQQTQVNNTSQTIYNEQYKEIFNEIDKDIQKNEPSIKPEITQTQENKNIQIVTNNDGINKSEPLVEHKEIQKPIQNESNQNTVQNSNQTQTQQTQLNNASQMINNEQYKEIFNDIEKDVPKNEPTIKPEITQTQENKNIQIVTNNDGINKGEPLAEHKEIQKPVQNESNQNTVQNSNQTQTQHTQVNNASQTIYNEQYKEIFNEIDQDVVPQKSTDKSLQENISKQTDIQPQKNQTEQPNNIKNENLIKQTDVLGQTNQQKTTNVLPEETIKPQSQNFINNTETTNQTINKQVNNEIAKNTNINVNEQTQVQTEKNSEVNLLPKQEIQQLPIKENIINTKNSIKNENEINNPKPIVNDNINKSVDFNKISNNINRSEFIRDILGLPKTFSEMLFISQNNNSTTNNNVLLNQNNLMNQKTLLQIFNDAPVVQPNINNIPDIINIQNQPNQGPQEKDVVTLIFSGMVHMPEISSLILKNSKHAAAQLVVAMASEQKQEINEHLKETLSALNMCVALADSGSPTQSLKSLMLLYLPWLPLNDGIGFDMEIESSPGENESNDSKLTVLIQTRHFNNVKGTFTLLTSNSVDALILCSDDFPKATLQKMLKEECDSHSMSTTIDVESVTPIKKELNSNQETKVNLSATNEMNPYLLLMAHSFIRHTIEIDTRAEYSMAANQITT